MHYDGKIAHEYSVQGYNYTDAGLQLKGVARNLGGGFQFPTPPGYTLVARMHTYVHGNQAGIHINYII